MDELLLRREFYSAGKPAGTFVKPPSARTWFEVRAFVRKKLPERAGRQPRSMSSRLRHAWALPEQAKIYVNCAGPCI